MNIKLSAVILTKNEELNIINCIQSLKFCDEIVIVDDYSQDKTLELVKKFNHPNLKLYKQYLNSDFSAQRNFGLSLAKGEWILFVDADERISVDLAHEIQNIIQQSQYNGFTIKRNDTMWGKALQYGEVGHIFLLRLGRKGKGKWKGKVHERWEIMGNIGIINNPIMHSPHQTIKEFLAEVNYYSTLRSEELYAQKVHSNLISIVLYPKAKFIYGYFLKQGFRDGIEGLLVAVIMSIHSFLVRAKLYFLQTKK